MQAIVARDWGGPEVLRLERVSDPTPGEGEVVVELRASAVNWHDVLVRRTGRGFSLPRILGMDGAGVRRDTREEVVILPALNWGPRREAPGLDFEFLGDVSDGTYAELVCVPAQNVFAKPPGWSWQEAAALPTAGVTAYRALFTRAQLRTGETVLVIGAGSGVSTFAVSLAVAIGAQAIVTSSSADKLALARELGAESGAVYTDADWVEQVRELSGGGVDVAVDGTGGNMAAVLECLRPGGRLVVFGASAGPSAEIRVAELYFSQRSILGTSIGDSNDFADLLKLAAHASWRPVIDSIRPLEQVTAAHERIEARAHFGKLLLLNQA